MASKASCCPDVYLNSPSLVHQLQGFQTCVCSYFFLSLIILSLFSQLSPLINWSYLSPTPASLVPHGLLLTPSDRRRITLNFARLETFARSPTRSFIIFGRGGISAKIPSGPMHRDIKKNRVYAQSSLSDKRFWPCFVRLLSYHQCLMHHFLSSQLHS